MRRPGPVRGTYVSTPSILPCSLSPLSLASRYTRETPLITKSDNGAAVWMASSVEANVGIIFACMHAIKPILSKIIPGLFGTGGSADTRTSYDDRKGSSDHHSGSKAFPFRTFSAPPASTRNDTFNPDSSTVAINCTEHDPLPAICRAPVGVNGRVTIGTPPGSEVPSHGIRYTQKFEVKTAAVDKEGKVTGDDTQGKF
jgi:hypothetical protein